VKTSTKGNSGGERSQETVEKWYFFRWSAERRKTEVKKDEIGEGRMRLRRESFGDLVAGADLTN